MPVYHKCMECEANASYECKQIKPCPAGERPPTCGGHAPPAPLSPAHVRTRAHTRTPVGHAAATGDRARRALQETAGGCAATCVQDSASDLWFSKWDHNSGVCVVRTHPPSL